MPKHTHTVATTIFPILDALQCLSYYTDEVVVPLVVPEVGYARLAKLYRAIYDTLERFGTLPVSRLRSNIQLRAIPEHIYLATYQHGDRPTLS